jgi:hypothetical protein
LVLPCAALTLAQTAQSETSTVAAMAVLMSVRLRFIHFPFLDFLRLKERIKIFKRWRDSLSVVFQSFLEERSALEEPTSV